MKTITNALISVYDKEGLEVFARGLLEERISIISTGGTAKILGKAGITTTKVEDITNFPEILDGRVKTLNPKIHGGILAVREMASRGCIGFDGRPYQAAHATQHYWFSFRFPCDIRTVGL